MLTDEMIDAAEPRPAGYKMSDSGGLHVYVTPTGAKSFRFKYRVGRVEKRLTFGLFPHVRLEEARRLRDEAKDRLKIGPAPDVARPLIDVETLDRMLTPEARSAEPHRVYFVRREGGDIKIGVTRDVRRRIANLQTSFAEPLMVIGSMPGSYAVEMTLHRLFAEDRRDGEWFRPPARLLDFIEDQIDQRGF